MSIRKRAIFILATLAGGYLLALSNAPLHLPSTCLFHRITGLPCISCGMTHACCALAHGNLHDALNFHIGVIPFTLAIAAASILLTAEAFTNRPLLAPAWHKTSRLLIPATLAVFSVGWAINLFKILHA